MDCRVVRSAGCHGAAVADHQTGHVPGAVPGMTTEFSGESPIRQVPIRCQPGWQKSGVIDCGGAAARPRSPAAGRPELEEGTVVVTQRVLDAGLPAGRWSP